MEELRLEEYIVFERGGGHCRECTEVRVRKMSLWKSDKNGLTNIENRGWDIASGNEGGLVK